MVNARGTATLAGGTLMAPEVVEAMLEVARSFVRSGDLQEAASRQSPTSPVPKPDTSADGRPVPMTVVSVDGRTPGHTAVEVVRAFEAMDPIVMVGDHDAARSILHSIPNLGTRREAWWSKRSDAYRDRPGVADDLHERPAVPDNRPAGLDDVARSPKR